MKRVFSLVSPERKRCEIIDINWTLCFICQHDTPGEQLVCPFQRKGMHHEFYFMLYCVFLEEVHHPMNASIHQRKALK